MSDLKWATYTEHDRVLVGQVEVVKTTKATVYVKRGGLTGYRTQVPLSEVESPGTGMHLHTSEDAARQYAEAAYLATAARLDEQAADMRRRAAEVRRG